VAADPAAVLLTANSSLAVSNLTQEPHVHPLPRQRYR
jgi:hypothetical protein